MTQAQSVVQTSVEVKSSSSPSSPSVPPAPVASVGSIGSVGSAPAGEVITPMSFFRQSSQSSHSQNASPKLQPGKASPTSQALGLPLATVPLAMFALGPGSAQSAGAHNPQGPSPRVARTLSGQGTGIESHVTEKTQDSLVISVAPPTVAMGGHGRMMDPGHEASLRVSLSSPKSPKRIDPLEQSVAINENDMFAQSVMMSSLDESMAH